MDDFLWDSLRLQPARLCVLRPQPHARHAFLIVGGQMGHVQSKKDKQHPFDQIHRMTRVSEILASSVWVFNLLRQHSTEPLLKTKAGRLAACLSSRTLSSSAIGANESLSYVMRLAFVQRTSDGNCGPSPSFRVTQWIWHTPNMARRMVFHINTDRFILETSRYDNICTTWTVFERFM